MTFLKNTNLYHKIDIIAPKFADSFREVDRRHKTDFMYLLTQRDILLFFSVTILLEMSGENVKCFIL